MDHKDFIQKRLFDNSEVALREASDRKLFEIIASQILQKVDLNTDRNRILIDAYNFLIKTGINERSLTLLLGLLDGGMAIIESTEEYKRRAIAQLEREIANLGEEHDEDTVDALETDIHILRTGTFAEVSEILKKKHELKSLKRDATPFEAAFVRYELRNRNGVKSGKLWKNLRGRLALIFGLSPQQISSVKAWESENLRGKGGKTVDDLISEIRIKVESQANGKKGKKSEDNPTRKTEKNPAQNPTENGNPAAIAAIYQSIQSEHLAHLKALEPATFQMEVGKILPAQRRWIFALMILAYENNRRAVRKLLAEEVFHCSVAKIAAVTAYLSGGCRERASDEVKADIKITEDYLINAQATSITQEQQGPPPSLEESGSLENGPTEDGNVEVLNDQRLHFLAPEEFSTQDGNLEEHQTLARKTFEGGEHFEYDNEIKEAWRQKIKEYIEANTTLEERSRMKVLCLPGKACLEIPIYLELGFQAKNIIGVEGGDKQAREEFKTNAKKYGINIFIGDLEDMLIARKTPFDIVSLDFTGPICEKYLRMMEQIPIKKKTILIINVMAKRESAPTRKQNDLMANYLEETNPSKGLYDRDFHGIMTRLVEAFKGEEKKELKETREPCMSNALLGALGRKNDHMYKKKQTELKRKVNEAKIPFGLFSGSVCQYLELVLISVMQTLGLHPLQAIMFSASIRALAPAALNNKFFIKGYKKFSYYSHGNKDASPSPFFTDCIILESRDSLYKQCSATINFIYEILHDFIKKQIRGVSPEEYGHWSITTTGDLAWRSANGEILSTLNIKQSLDHAIRFLEGMIGDLGGLNLEEIQREIIKVSD